MEDHVGKLPVATDIIAKLASDMSVATCPHPHTAHTHHLHAATHTHNNTCTHITYLQRALDTLHRSCDSCHEHSREHASTEVLPYPAMVNKPEALDYGSEGHQLYWLCTNIIQ